MSQMPRGLAMKGICVWRCHTLLGVRAPLKLGKAARGSLTCVMTALLDPQLLMALATAQLSNQSKVRLPALLGNFECLLCACYPGKVLVLQGPSLPLACRWALLSCPTCTWSMRGSQTGMYAAIRVQTQGCWQGAPQRA
jgi:hypothetical protein